VINVYQRECMHEELCGPRGWRGVSSVARSRV
jgi:hypothetical protein